MSEKAVLSELFSPLFLCLHWLAYGVNFSFHVFLSCFFFNLHIVRRLRDLDVRLQAYARHGPGGEKPHESETAEPRVLMKDHLSSSEHLAYKLRFLHVLRFFLFLIVVFSKRRQRDWPDSGPGGETAAPSPTRSPSKILEAESEV